MNKYRLYQLGFIVIGVILSCSKAEELLLGIPRVATGKDIFTNQAGAIFQADVLSAGSQVITDHGFQWREFGKTQIDFKSIGTLTGNTFELEVNQGFEENKQYEVRAYISSADFTAYGEWVKFSGAGSMAPQITGFSPAQATWGDTLTITGNFFSNNSSIVKVEFEEVIGDLISTSEEMIKVKVPNNFIKTSTVFIRVKVGSKFGNTSQAFSLLGTQVLQVTPNKGSSGTVVVIKGKYFNPTHSLVKFGDVSVPIAQAYKDSLKLILPKEVSGGEKDVTVISGPFQATLFKVFSRNYPIITEIVPSVAFFGDTITLKGENFGFPFNDNYISTGSNSATIVDSKQGELKIILPIESKPLISFQVTADYVTSQSDKKLTIKKPVITEVVPAGPIYPGQKVTLKGKYFFPCSECYNYNTYEVKMGEVKVRVTSAKSTEIVFELPILKVNSSTVQLSYYDSINVASSQAVVTPIISSAKFEGSLRVKATSFSIGSKAYVLTGLVDGSMGDNTVYEFDGTNKNWKPLSDFPGEPRYGATAFTLNNKGYLLGGYTSSGSGLRDLWEYDPVNSTWKRKNDFLFHPMEAFNLNGNIYCISDIKYHITPPNTEIDGFGYYSGLWKYDPATDSWTEKSMLPGTLQRGDFQDYFTMQINGILTTGYFTDQGYLYHSYNPQNDEWIPKGLATIDARSPITFEYAGNGYLLTDRYLYKYTVSTNKWEMLEDNLNPFLWQGGEATKFRVNNKWYFSLFNYNGRFFYEPFLAYSNMVIELDCSTAGF